METSKEIKIAGYTLSAFFIGFILIVIISGFLFNSSGNETIKSDYVVGKSMEPALHDGDYVSYDITRLDPSIGEIVAFECFTEKCINGNSSIGKLKRLTKIDDRGCYWFEGDNKEYSWDSRFYGWLCSPDDVKILGILIK